jgi:hypothetical protein
MSLAGIYTSLFLCGRIPRYSLVPSLKEPELKRLSSEFGGNDEEWVPWAKKSLAVAICVIARRDPQSTITRDENVPEVGRLIWNSY